MMDGNRTVISLTNGQGVTVTTTTDHGKVGESQGQNLATFVVTSADGSNTIGFELNRENRRRFRAMIDMMDI